MDRKEEVQKLAGLARIEVSDAEATRFAKEFDDILAYVGQLESLAVAQGRVVPRVRNSLREDGAPHETGIHTTALRDQFPDREGDALKVKQIISHD